MTATVISILSVDDDPFYLRVLERLLEQGFAREFGCTMNVTSVLDVLSALDELNRTAFDLVITDLMLGMINGDVLVRRIRDGGIEGQTSPTSRDVPIITISMDTTGPPEANAHIVKPFEVLQLKQVIFELLRDKWR